MPIEVPSKMADDTVWVRAVRKRMYTPDELSLTGAQNDLGDAGCEQRRLEAWDANAP